MSSCSMADTELNIFRESLDLVILKSLTWGPRHGYGIAEWIERATGTVLLVDEGTLYPALHRLARKRLVATEWGLSENNRRAKYYAIAPAGRAVLRSHAPVWHRFAQGIATALHTTAGDLA
jgi:PadR family transcriptional regulator, regulatory protein PadR